MNAIVYYETQQVQQVESRKLLTPFLEGAKFVIDRFFYTGEPYYMGKITEVPTFSETNLSRKMEVELPPNIILGEE